MEALAAISLAGNVLQFVHLGLVVLEHVRDYRDGTIYQNCETLKDELADLRKLSTWLQDPALSQHKSVATRGLWVQASKCQAITIKMEVEVDKLGVNSGNKRKLWWGIIKSPFIARVLDKLGQELNLVESQMQLYLTATQKDDLLQILSVQKGIDSKLNRVEKAIMRKIVDDDGQPLQVDESVIVEQLERLHNATIETFSERLGGIQTQLEEINGTLKQLASQQSPSSTGDVSGRALWTAIADGNESLVNNLLERGVDTTFTNIDARNESCLHLAACRSNDKVLRSLLQHKPDLDIYSDEGITPLTSATISKKSLNAELLINAGADIEAPLRDNTRHSVSGRVDIDNVLTKGSTALFLAAQHGHLELVQLLISRGANVNVQTNHLFTPLHAASMGGYLEIVRLLIDHGAGIDAITDQQFTPLIYAVHFGQDEVTRLLLKSGANIEAKKSHSMTALSEAFWKRRAETIKLLLNHGANIEGDVPPIANQPSWLHWAIDIDSAEVVRILLDRKRDLEFWSRKSGLEELLRVADHCGNEEIRVLVRSHLT